MNPTKHLLSLALSLTMLLSAMPQTTALAAPPPFGSIQTQGGTPSNNVSVTNTLKKSFLTANASGGVTRVEALGDTVCVETYSKELQLVSSLSTDYPLPIFGGYYAGASGNYLAFGQSNPDEDDETEVLRIEKYDENWKYVDAISYYGCNTQTPFTAGTLRMTELDGKLYVLTCHRMYTSDDGLNHQANMGFVIDTTTMESLDARYNVSSPMRPSSIGRYCSHSFDQYITNDGKDLYTVDLGDAYPRAVMVTRNDVCFEVLPIKGEIGDNNTGVTLGGINVTDSTCIVAGASIDQSEESTNTTKNIFVSTTDKTTMNSTLTWLTDYTNEVIIGTPYVVPMSNQCTLLAWQVKTASSSSLSYVLLDEKGVPCYDPLNFSYTSLSDCAPIAWNDVVLWYTADGDSPTFYQINYPYGYPTQPLPELIGDANKDHAIDVSDLVMIARFVAEDPELPEPFSSTSADCNQDGIVNADDLSEMARFLAKFHTGMIGLSVYLDA